jgi:hypothetical protein
MYCLFYAGGINLFRGALLFIRYRMIRLQLPFPPLLSLTLPFLPPFESFLSLCRLTQAYGRMGGAKLDNKENKA